jgi:hypothetical protein
VYSRYYSSPCYHHGCGCLVLAILLSCCCLIPRVKGQEVNRTFDEALRVQADLTRIEKELNGIGPLPHYPKMIPRPAVGQIGRLPPEAYVTKPMESGPTLKPKFFGWCTLKVQGQEYNLSAVFVHDCEVKPPIKFEDRHKVRGSHPSDWKVLIGDVPAWKVVGYISLKPNTHAFYPVLEPLKPSKKERYRGAKSTEADELRSRLEKLRLSLPPKDRDRLDDYSVQQPMQQPDQESQALRLLTTAQLLLQSEPSLARLRLQELLSKYPETSYAKEARSILNKVSK